MPQVSNASKYDFFFQTFKTFQTLEAFKTFKAFQTLEAFKTFKAFQTF